MHEPHSGAIPQLSINLSTRNLWKYDPSIVEAVINVDGFLIGARVLNREVTFERIPKIIIVGGGGYGAKLMPSLSCLSEDRLVEVGATKIGTGRYVDCP